MDESSGYVYVIKSIQGDIYKVGFTRNWSRRRKELEIGTKTKEVRVFPTRDAYEVEKSIHRRWDWKRLPQSEWFALSDEEVGKLIKSIEITCQQAQEDWDKKLSEVRGTHSKEAYERALSQTSRTSAKRSTREPNKRYTINSLQEQKRATNARTFSWKELKYPIGGVVLTLFVQIMIVALSK